MKQLTDTWLTPDELADLTGRKRWTAQCRALAQMGVPFRPNGVGRPLVERAAVLSATKPTRQPRGPNWDAIRRGQAA